ncbi:MAG: hypothetical protein QOF79_1492 [Actinomycetota bacterium]|nr:hypothetical protein [Actinomycetota bacterium]
MATCVGCGAELAPTWKYCIHCGIATDAHEVRPSVRATRPAKARFSTRALVGGGVALFLVIAAVLIVAIVALTGGFS